MKKLNIPVEHLSRLRRIRGLARLMDTALRVPGTRISLGADSVLGLIPGVGDFAAAAVSLVIVIIIMAVMANTMSMTARERLSEYATLKALGFPPGFIVQLLFGESLVIALLGGGLGLALTLPIAAAFAKSVGTLFPVFLVSDLTMALQLAASVVVGLVAAAWPAWKMSRISIVNGLRHVA